MSTGEENSEELSSQESNTDSNVTIKGEKTPLIKPDHVSLGQCVVHQEFTRKYSSVKDVDIVNLLHDGCKFNGFQDLLIDSSEQEGFANMHHILLLASLDDLLRKELCVQRANNIDINVQKLKEEREVLTDINSVVIIIPDQKVSLDLYFFTKGKHSTHRLDYPKNDFKAMLMSDVLTLEFESHILVLNFRGDVASVKQFELASDVCVLSTSMELLVSSKPSHDVPRLFCDYLHDGKLDSIVVSRDTLTELKSGQLITVKRPTATASAEQVTWISANDKKLSIYTLTNTDELNVQYEVDIEDFFPDSDDFFFINVCYCTTTQQAFMLYMKELREEMSSFIVVFDLNKLKVTSVLEMEMTLNRRPDLVMYPLRDGSRLFVQEIFENRVIFYQAFTLLPVDHMMQNLNL